MPIGGTWRSMVMQGTWYCRGQRVASHRPAFHVFAAHKVQQRRGTGELGVPENNHAPPSAAAPGSALPRGRISVFLNASPAGALTRRGLFGRFLYLWRLDELVALEDELLD